MCRGGRDHGIVAGDNSVQQGTERAGHVCGDDLRPADRRNQNRTRPVSRLLLCARRPHGVVFSASRDSSSPRGHARARAVFDSIPFPLLSRNATSSPPRTLHRHTHSRLLQYRAARPIRFPTRGDSLPLQRAYTYLLPTPPLIIVLYNRCVPVKKKPIPPPAYDSKSVIRYALGVRMS